MAMEILYLCNVAIKMYIVLICLLRFETFGISVDYYDDRLKNERPHNVTYKPDARRTIMDVSEAIINVTACSTDCDEDVEDKIILSFQIDKTPRPINTLTRTKYTIQSLEPVNVTSKTHTRKESTKRSDAKAIFYLHSFTDYDYDHQNVEVKDVQKEHYLERSFHNDLKIKQTNRTQENHLSFGMFYNLEPAADQELLKGENKRNFTNVWYVPHDLPCWELPLVYGELGAKKNKSRVFLVYGGNLINVFDPWTESRSTFKAADVPITHFVNKWCGVQPCYGDHTLCLFPNKDISKICDKGYTVKTPSIYDQNNIVNIINTMRNRVANGLSLKYAHLPAAANMKQMMYDYDLEKISEAWLRQCLPGSAPCSGLDGHSVTQLECTKYSKFCCLKYFKTAEKCTPRPECFIDPVIGCLHIWYSSAGDNLTPTDVSCGHATVLNFNTVQVLWAKTTKLGCAYAIKPNGDIRIVCNFSPGAPFQIDTKLYCGIIAHSDLQQLRGNEKLMDLNFLNKWGIEWNRIIKIPRNISLNVNKLDSQLINIQDKSMWGVDSLTKIYTEGWVRKHIGNTTNGTKSAIARLVSKYTFIDNSESRCDSDESVYESGKPGSLCIETGATYNSLCYDFKDPTPGYRLIAVAAPITLFSLILYDLFSGVVRQTNY